MPTLHDFTMKTIDGEERPLGGFRGKALMVVNVASRCGLTPQYEDLQRVHEEYAPRGFAVLGFPCNQFAGQEPGTDADVKQFCTVNYGVTFPMFSKVDVNGAARAPLYAWLTEQTVGPDPAGDIKWNFAKFVVDKQGNVVARFDPTTKPSAPEVKQAIERALA
ncbi:MAG: glutathione peroxidase [Thermodesulfobacteriota bacterium]